MGREKPTFEEKLAALQNQHDVSFAKIGYYRCYDGCPDTALRLKGEIEDLIWKEVKKLEPEACCTYFPVEEKYQVHKNGKGIGGFLYDKNAAMREALEVLRKRQPVAGGDHAVSMGAH